MAGVPGPVAERLNAVWLEIVKDEAVKKKLAELGLVTTGSTPAAFPERVRRSLRCPVSEASRSGSKTPT